MHRALTSVFIAGLIAAPVTAALAADGPDITIYHARDNALFQPGQGAVDSGYAMVREQRRVGFEKGTQDLVVGSLPDYLEPEAISLHFSGRHVRVLAQRVLLATGGNDALLGQIGKPVSILGANGQVLVKGQLERVDRNGTLVIGGDVFGPTVVRHYSAVKLISGEAGTGSRLQVRLQADAGGHAEATLSYPTHGLGWRAAYTGTLQPGARCRMRLTAEASIANRSGRDWQDADIKLFAGQPNIQSRYSGPRPMMAGTVSRALPVQQSIDAYRMYTLPGRVNLPDNSVTLTPLYAPDTLDCEREWVFQTGSAWTPPQPITEPSRHANPVSAPVIGELRFTAPKTLPAGIMRVLAAAPDGSLQFIGQDNVPDTSRKTPVSLTLGNAFDLHATRTRTHFQYDKANDRIDEAFQVQLSNAGDTPRTISVIQHPDRWSQWTLTSSSIKPARQDANTLVFEVDVPAHGSATLDYALQYQWTPVTPSGASR